MTHTSLGIWPGLLTLALVAACSDKGGESGTTGVTDDTAPTTNNDDTGGTTTTDDTGGTTTALSYTLEGQALDLATHDVAAAGLCVVAFNADAAVTGGDPVEMARATVAAGGVFSISGVDAKPAFGILLSVRDCNDEGTVVPTATPVLPSAYSSVVTGDTISGLAAFSVSAAFGAGIDGSLAAVGYPGTIATDGALMGGVWDNTYTPIDGATVTGATTVFYQDTDSADGLYSTGTSLNAATSAAAGSLFLIPAAAVSTYSATAEGYTFGGNTLGSSPGSIVFAPIIAN